VPPLFGAGFYSEVWAYYPPARLKNRLTSRYA
jgi:hypothetical protein